MVLQGHLRWQAALALSHTGSTVPHSCGAVLLTRCVALAKSLPLFLGGCLYTTESCPSSEVRGQR